MSHNIQRYWKEVRSLEQTLPAVVWLVGTTAGAPPFVTQVASDIAAKMLHARSHRIASDEEVAAHHANDAVALQQAKEERMRRKGEALVVVENAVVEDEPTSEPSPRRRR